MLYNKIIIITIGMLNQKGLPWNCGLGLLFCHGTVGSVYCSAMELWARFIVMGISFVVTIVVLCCDVIAVIINPLNAELNPTCH
jgi:hypothetical protein